MDGGRSHDAAALGLDTGLALVIATSNGYFSFGIRQGCLDERQTYMYGVLGVKVVIAYRYSITPVH